MTEHSDPVARAFRHFEEEKSVNAIHRPGGLREILAETAIGQPLFAKGYVSWQEVVKRNWRFQKVTENQQYDLTSDRDPSRWVPWVLPNNRLVELTREGIVLATHDFEHEQPINRLSVGSIVAFEIGYFHLTDLRLAASTHL